MQSLVLQRKRAILADPVYGQVPPLPADAGNHRLFQSRLAHPPRMWSTHPPNAAREENAKKIYVHAPIDERSSWTLFDDAAALRKQVTAQFYGGIEEPLSQLSSEESIAAISKHSTPAPGVIERN